jgi:hypothetical protein
MTTSAAVTASLLGLPAELRNEIWTLALIEYEEATPTDIPGSIQPRRKTQYIPSHCLSTVEAWPQPPITRVSRQIRHETLGLSYELCIFSVTVSSMMMFPLRTWADIIGLESCRKLKHIEIVWKQSVSTRTNEMMAAQRFRASEVGRAVEGALRFEGLFAVSCNVSCMIVIILIGTPSL